MPLKGHRSYARAALYGAVNAGLTTAPFLAPRAEEFFYTIDFSRVKEGEKAADAVAVRERRLRRRSKRVRTRSFGVKQ